MNCVIYFHGLNHFLDLSRQYSITEGTLEEPEPTNDLGGNYGALPANSFSIDRDISAEIVPFNRVKLPRIQAIISLSGVNLTSIFLLVLSIWATYNDKPAEVTLNGGKQ